MNVLHGGASMLSQNNFTVSRHEKCPLREVPQGRYIDADVLLKELDKREYSREKHDFKMLINNQPTAYNPEKVVEELKDMSIGKEHCAKCDQRADCEDSFYRICVLDAKYKAIEIAKNGGVK